MVRSDDTWLGPNLALTGSHQHFIAIGEGESSERSRSLIEFRSDEHAAVANAKKRRRVAESRISLAHAKGGCVRVAVTHLAGRSAPATLNCSSGPMLRPLLQSLVVLCALVRLGAQTPYGLPTRDTVTQSAPAILLPETVLAGQSTTVTLCGTAAVVQQAMLIVGSRPAAGSIGSNGVRMHVDQGAGAVSFTIPLSLVPNGSSGGRAEASQIVSMPLGTYYCQLVVVGASGLAASPGYEIVVTPPGQGGNAHNRSSAVGTNLAGVVDWTTQLPFQDVFKTSRSWISGDANTWSNGWAIQVDGDGNVTSLLPNQVVRTVMFTDIPNRFPGGRYVFLYEGSGTFSISGAATRIPSASSPGREVLNINSSSHTVILSILTTNPQDPLRNFRMFREQDEATYATEVFNPEFLARTRKFAVLRFMDWQRTNNSTLTSWSERPQPTDARWSGQHGVPLEVMLSLANRLQADAWFCLPHLADDDFVTQFALQVRSQLAPNLKVYIEYSNEVWNGQFGQATYAQQRGLALNLSTNAFQAQLRYHSLRSVKIFRIFEEVFGGTSRLVRVLGTQSANPWVGVQIMDWNGAASEADALAGAPYFGPSVSNGNANQIAAMSVEQLLDHIGLVEIPAVFGSVVQGRADAQARGLRYITYEGGQHLVGTGVWQNDVAMTNLLCAANRHPRMADLYKQYLDGWRVAGGDLLVHFSDIGTQSRYGSWGTLEHRDQDPADAPKFLALQQYLMLNPRWW